MTTEPGSPRDDARDLLSATRSLTRRVRLAQRGAWFPLLVFAAVTLGAAPFDRYGRHPTHCGFGQGGTYVCSVNSALALWYWPAALLAGYAAIGWFYLRRSEGRGVGTRAQPFVAVGVLLTVLAAAWAFWAHTHPAFLAGTLHLAPGHQPSEALYRIATPAGAIGLALLLLAWIERSWALFIVTVAYLIVAVGTVGIGHFSHPTPWAFLPHLLVDAWVLLAGAVVLAVIQQAGRPSHT